MEGPDLSCRCIGADRRTPCERQATGEDGLCDGCRRNDCPNSPLAEFMEGVDELHSKGIYGGKRYEREFDKLMQRYLERCRKEGVQP